MLKVNRIETNNKRGFTLVELIVVMAIIMVLGTAALVKLTSWFSKSRDAKRISDLSMMDQSLSIYLIEGKELPLPDNKVDIKYSGNVLLYQGEFGRNVYNALGNISKLPKDPKDNKLYTYAINVERNKYEVMVMLENEGG